MGEQFQTFDRPFDPDRGFSVGDFNRMMRADAEAMQSRLMPALSDGDLPAFGLSNRQHISFWAKIVGRGTAGDYSYDEVVPTAAGGWVSPDWARIGNATTSPGAKSVNPAWESRNDPSVPIDGTVYVLMQYRNFDPVTGQNYAFTFPAKKVCVGPVVTAITGIGCSGGSVTIGYTTGYFLIDFGAQVVTVVSSCP